MVRSVLVVSSFSMRAILVRSIDIKRDDSGHFQIDTISICK